jgi:hypothetical protein
MTFKNVITASRKRTTSAMHGTVSRVGKKINVSFDNYTKHMKKNCGQNTEFVLMLKQAV